VSHPHIHLPTLAREIRTDGVVCSVIICVVYYYLWIYLIPYWRGYRVRQEILQLDDGANSHRLIKVPVAELDEWDRRHDPVGRQIDSAVGSSTGFEGDEKNPAIVTKV
jgi:hypothetical protein